MKIDKQWSNEKLKVHLGIGKNYDKFQLENGIKSPYEKWKSLIRMLKLKSVQKLERNSRNITKIDKW